MHYELLVMKVYTPPRYLEMNIIFPCGQKGVLLTCQSNRMGHLPPHCGYQPLDKRHSRRWRPTLSFALSDSRRAVD